LLRRKAEKILDESEKIMDGGDSAVS